ncbi:MAG TPA: DUF72 domain-containing protein [Acidobacteriaceae bacterium]|nr:DUF72 domain-containing protein [Acidobacteriaceae bacterium]
MLAFGNAAGPIAPPHVFAGTSGWAYPAWKPGFYPAGVSAKRFLEYYATQLNSVEVNFTFRKLPTESMLTGWLSAVPAGFQFSFKAPQRITHFNRLRNCEGLVTDFVSSVRPAQEAGKLGLLLFQLPPNFKASPHILTDFLSIPALNGPSSPKITFEFRDTSWFAEDVYALLREHNAALCVAETDDLRTPDVHCARTHASFRLRRAGGYNSEDIKRLAEAVVPLAADRDVYLYFKHEDDPTGALNAVEFLAESSRVAKL